MADTVNALSSDTGLPVDLVQKGLGAILDFLKQHLNAETFERIQHAIPNSGEFLQSFEAAIESAKSGGLLSALGGLASKFLGGGAGDVAKLLESFGSIGLKPEQIEAFLPRAIAFVKSHIPPELLEQILAKFPALAELAGAKAE
jgi:Protein of unknown function VcgC/VcgE (DUF2780)